MESKLKTSLQSFHLEPPLSVVLEGAGRSSYNAETDTVFKVFQSHSNSLYIVEHAWKKIPVLLIN